MEAIVFAENQVLSTSQNKKNGRSPFKQLLEKYEYPHPQRGDIIQGKILRLEEDIVYVDVGSKRDAMVPYGEVSQLDDTFLANLSRGDEVPVYVTRTPVGDDELLVSLEQGLQQQDWDRAEKIQKSDATIELKVVDHNKGGLIVEFGRIQGFVPNSHVPELQHIRYSKKRQQYKINQIDKTLPLKIIEVNAKQQRFVLSATDAQREQQKLRLKKLNVGDIVRGQIVNIKKYGAFIEIGHGLTGLLHISKITWTHITHPEDVLVHGQDIEVVIDNIDIEKGRISLNRKTLLPDPWEEFAATHQVGDLVDGTVTSIVKYGVFVQVAPGVEGLLHMNEMNIHRDTSPEEALQTGDQLLLWILDLDSKKQRLGLSMRRLSTTKEQIWIPNKS